MIPAATNPTLQKFLTPDSFIFETARWVLTLRPLQPTLGSTVLISKSDVTAVTDLSPEDVTDLHAAWQKVGAMYRATFQPDKMNHLALMMTDPNPHFHILPRYAEKRAFDGSFFADTAWPTLPNTREADLDLTSAQRVKLAEYLRNAI
ncbi:MAG: HIT family protein [Bdellovibrionales bacterium]